MERCEFCGQITGQRDFVKNVDRRAWVCSKCFKEQEALRISRQLETVERAVDYKPWSKRDLSEAFWTHLGIYVKHPNQRSRQIIYQAFLWVVHDDKGLANSFSHAFQWAKIDIHEELERTDLPETYSLDN